MLQNIDLSVVILLFIKGEDHCLNMERPTKIDDITFLLCIRKWYSMNKNVSLKSY